MSPTPKLIEVKSFSGRPRNFLYVVADAHMPHYEEESSEMVTNFKPTLRNLYSEAMEEDFLLQINQDFALETEDFYVPEKAAPRRVEKKANPFAPTLGDDVWWEMNEDFARENSFEESETIRKPQRHVSSVEECYGDYGVWWE